MLGEVRFGQLIAVGAAILVAIGCSGDKLRPAGADVRVEPVSVQFSATVVGKTSSASIRVVNSGRATMTLRLASEEPFASSVSTVVAPAGGESSFEVTFAPKQPGSFEAKLRIEGDDGQLVRSVPLVGEAQLQSGCGLGDDGVACMAPCLSEGTCRQGICVGVSPSCDDQNACTADGCGQDGTCVHVDVSASCPAPAADPCHVPTCDPLTGCGSAPVVDGTACGPNDCVNALVCVAGECRSVPAPDGSACGTATLCQAAGTCQSHTCVLPPRGPVVAWSIPDESVLFGPLADAADNVYWIHIVPSDSHQWSEELVSVDRDGRERFRIAMDDQYREMAIVHGVLIIDNEPGFVDARRLSDGQLIWSLDLSALVANEFPAGVAFALYRPARALEHPDGTLRLVFHNAELGDFGDPNFAPLEWILTVDPSSGQVLEKRHTDMALPSVGPNGELFFYEAGGLVSSTADGGVIWYVPISDGSGVLPVPATSGVWVQDGVLNRYESGSTAWSAPFALTWRYSSLDHELVQPVTSDGWTVVLGESADAGAWIYGIDETRGLTAQWAHVASDPIYAAQPVLAEDGTAIEVWDQIPIDKPRGVWRFGLFHRDTTFEWCNLFTAGEERWPSSPILLDGRLIIASSQRVFAIQAPGLREATHGWTGSRGGRYLNFRYR